MLETYFLDFSSCVGLKIGCSTSHFGQTALPEVGYTRSMTKTEAAVVGAAKQWLAAKEAMLIADETRQDDPAETEHALDDAEYALTDAVYRLLGREPAIPLKS